MVAQHYRWDFVGLSTDTKPTPETSEKVVDGSTFYCSDTSKLYVFCKTRWYERKALGGGGGGGTSYTAGNGIDITDDIISVDSEVVQDKLIAGSNVSISAQNVISATDTTYSAFTGTDGTAAGTAGLVPAPATTDTDKFLKSDGTWATAGGGGGGVTVVQTTGTSTTDVMSQDATTKLVYPDITNSPYKMVIGEGSIAGTNKGLVINGVLDTGITGGSVAIGATDASYAQIGTSGRADNSVAIGNGANVARGMHSIAIGASSFANSGQNAGDNIAIGYDTIAGGGSATSTVALGAYAQASRTGEVNIGTGSNGSGYNSTNYRVLGGVHDGQLAQDAVTVSQVNGLIDAINTALNTNIPHIGA